MADRTGITERHARACASRTGARCNCEPSYQAWYFDKRALNKDGTRGKKVRKTFSGKGALTAAKNWRAESSRAVRLKQLRAPTNRTVRQAVEEFLAGAERGEIRNKRKEPYKPAVIRQYRSALEKRFLPEFGEWREAEVDNSDLLAFKERLLGEGIADSTVRNVFVPVQAVFRRERRMGHITVNPADDLDLPSGAAARDRAATPTQAAELIDSLPEEDQALWASAFYAGLRRGELRALRVRDIGESYIDIAEDGGWDDRTGRQAPKSAAAIRRVPLTETLRTFLVQHLERTGRTGDDLVFGRTASLPFTPHHVSDRADEAWAIAAIGNFLQGNGNKIERFTLHECKHSFRTWLDHAGISETRADRYAAHSVGGMRGRYTHMLERQLADDASALDAYLAAASAGKVVALDVAS